MATVFASVPDNGGLAYRSRIMNLKPARRVWRSSSWIAALVLALPMSSAWAGTAAPPTVRLPSVASPVRYRVELWVDPALETFRGRAEIRVSLKEASDTIWLNGKGLTVEAASLVAAEGAKDALREEASTEGKDFIRLRLPRTLPAGEYEAGLTYTGPIGTKELAGVFRQKEGDDWYAFTQFEPIDARRAFPCFDEPSYKTPWQLTIHAPKGALAVSNAPVVSAADEVGGGRTFVFAPTKPLPSYMVAFGVGPFDVVDAGTAGRGKTPIRMIIPKARGMEARWAVESTGPLLERLEAYFDVPYPYEKLDHLVIPQFGGAMENPGLVTYGARYLLAKNADETIAFRRGYAGICAHETAHMWFGDWVTAAWWDDIWLNEAFATWMASKIVAGWKPEWNEDVERAASRSQAMSADSLVTARRIRQPIATNDDIVNAFDDITYTKGASVIGMFERWLGEEGFRKGVQRYLKAHAWGSATAEDFVTAIAEATKNPAVVSGFHSFLDQPGVPLVTAELACGAGAPKLLLSQKRFLPAGSTGSTAETWQLPVCIRAGETGAPATCTLLTGAAGELPLPGACPDRILANALSGYYRVLYKGDLLAKLLAEDGRHLTAAERVSTLSDTYNLVRSGKLPIASALALVPVFVNDPSRPVVEIARQIASVPINLLVTDGTRPRYQRFVSEAFGVRASALGWARRAGEDDETQLLRPAIVPFAANEGDEPALVAQAMRLARSWLKDRSAVDPLMVSAVLDVAARHGGTDLFQAYVAEAKRTTDRRERSRLFRAMGGFRDPAVIPTALELTLSSDFDARESIDVLWEEASSRETLPRAWAFLTANFDRLAGRMPEDSAAYFPWLASGFSDEARRADVETFFKGRAAKYAGGPRNLAQVLEVIQIRTAFKASQQASFEEFLRR